MGKVVKAVGKAIGGLVKSAFGFVGMLFKTPKTAKATTSQASESRLNLSLRPEENKKILFGETAMGTDLRYWETYGNANTRHVQVIAGAGHEIESFGNTYFDEIPAPFVGGIATGQFAGVVGRTTVTKGVSGGGFAIGAGAKWTAAAAMTGCAYFVLDWVYTQEKLPNGIPQRVTQVGKGAKVYDPRRDTTRGGSGTHRADNPATWAYATLDSNGQPIGRNNALQMLAYTLGIKVQKPATGEWILIGGRGAAPSDINFASFITAANDCELEGWYSDCLLSTGDSHSTNEGILEAASGGELLDTGGRFSYHVATNDTANIAASFDTGDIVGQIEWNQQKPMSEQFNEVPGTFTDPAALFQQRPLPMAFDQAYYDADGYKKRTDTRELVAVQNATQGQKLLRIFLNKSRFQGEFSAVFNLKALKVQNHDIVTLTYAPFGWVNKLFRVTQQGIAAVGGITLVLEEEHASIYAGGTITVVPPPSVGYGGDPSIEIAVTGASSLASGITTGNNAVDVIQLTWDVSEQSVKRTEIQYKKSTETYWQTYAPLRREQNFAVLAPLIASTAYNIRIRHVSTWNVPGPWLALNRTTNAVTRNAAGLVVYADGSLVQNLQPAEAGSDVTIDHTADSVVDQGPGATDPRDPDNIVVNGPFSPLVSVLQFTAPDLARFTISNMTTSSPPDMGGGMGNVRLTSSGDGASPYMQLNAIGETGRDVSCVRVKVRAAVDLPVAQQWRGICYAYGSWSGAKQLAVSAPVQKSGNDRLPTNKYTWIEWDFSGDAEFMAGTVTSFRFYLLPTGMVGRQLDLGWVAIGSRDADPLGRQNVKRYADQTIINTSDSVVDQGWFATENFMPPSRSLLGDTNNTFPDPDLIDPTLYSKGNVNSDFELVVNTNTSSKNAIIVRNGVQTGTIFILGPAWQVREGFTYIIGACGSSFGSGVNCQAAFGYRFYSDVEGTVYAGVGGYVWYDDTSDGRTKFKWGIIQAPAGAKSARNLFTRVGHATSTDGAIFSEPVVLKRNFDSRAASHAMFAGALIGRNPGNPLTSSNVSGTARVNIASFVLSGDWGSVTYNAGAISGLAYNTAYHIWAIDPILSGGTVTYVASTTRAAHTNKPDYYYIGGVVTLTSGGGTGTPPVDPNPEWDCVSAYAWLGENRLAGDAEVGDSLTKLTDDGGASFVGKITRIRHALTQCLKLTTESGIELVCSTTTPLTAEDGSIILSEEAKVGRLVGVWEKGMAEGSVRWEPIVGIAEVGKRPVVMISADDGTYAAGSEPDRLIFTHNIRGPKP